MKISLPPDSTPTSRLVTVLGFVVATAVLYLAKEVLIPIALALLFSFLLSPLVFWLERRGIKCAIAAVGTVLVLMCAVGGFGYLLAGQFVEFVDNLPNYRANIVEKIQAVKPGRESVLKRAQAAIDDISREMDAETTETVAVNGKTTASDAGTSGTTETTASNVEVALLPAKSKSEPQESSDPRVAAYEQLMEVKPDTQEDNRQKGEDIMKKAETDGGAGQQHAVPVQVVEGPPNAWQTFLDMVGPVVSILGNAGLVILFVVFFLLEREDLRDRIIRLAGQNKVRVTTEALEEAAKRVSRYLLMQLIVNVTYGIPVALGLWLIGVPNALLWGAMATVLRFIPYIGPWIAASMPIALSLAVFHSWTMPMLTVGLFVALELLSNNVMEPIVYGHSTGLSPVAIIVSAVFWTWLWGAVGLVLATPMTVCLVVVGTYVPQLAFLTVLLGDEPVLEDSARVYNRLLSGATDEAVDIAEKYLEEHGLHELYDDVLLPALEYAETDRSDEMLSSKRYDRLILTMTELTDAVNDKVVALEKRQDEKDTEDEDKPSPEPHSENEHVLPVRNITIVPVNDRTDEMAGQMLRQLLMKKDRKISVVSTGKLASEVIDDIREQNPEIILLSSVPPFAVTHARYLAKKLIVEFPDIKLYAGLWCGENTPETADEKLKQVGVEKIFTSLSEAALHI